MPQSQRNLNTEQLKIAKPERMRLRLLGSQDHTRIVNQGARVTFMEGTCHLASTAGKIATLAQCLSLGPSPACFLRAGGTALSARSRRQRLAPRMPIVATGESSASLAWSCMYIITSVGS